ncbi:hypothetical protein PR202_gb18366 [Eleusine coracana subsp. coracana]|uniref:F-box domain-containing protein n=1 Tax=Eleusine coracana subsp. coracana TaxID=191504 RepID=A0AAV5F5G0_ELECO|nr:hypothetical protein QOZ80_3BG0296730 [Eleusine coracana subsp. coracana]GJN30087.1 hypothetical protein PR202_gb18366 [Eleusine coracana subsp. coracana]
MGAGASDLTGAEPGSKVARAGLGDLPELCAAEVLLYLDAPDICRLARLNRAFRGAAAADFLWEAKLPENYGYLLGFVDGEREGEKSEMGKKDVYATLAKPVPFDDGKREFWLEKSKGGICMALSSKAMVITGIDDRRYWVHMPTTESRFNSVAYLQQIWWFEVVGEVDFCFPRGTYSLYFRLHLGKSSTRFGRRICSSEQIHGWDKKPVRFQFWTSDGQHSSSQCYLDEPGRWILYHVGDFVVSSSEQAMKLKYSLAQIDCTHTKAGLCVDSVLIYPKGFEPEKIIRPQK